MKINKIIIAAGLGLAFSASTQASTVQYVLDQSNVLADNIPYLSVTINDVMDNDDGGIAFTVQTLPSLNSIASGENFGIKSFVFNGDFSTSGSIEFTGSALDTWIERDAKNISEFGIFQTVLTTGKGNNTLDELTFVIHKSGDSIDDYTVENALGNIFAAHVINLNIDSTQGENQHSAWFAGNAEGAFPPSAVPVPAAAWLFGSGLLGMVGVARRRQIA